MSWVTDVLLLFGLEETCVVQYEDESWEEIESEGLTGVNAWLARQGYPELVDLQPVVSRASQKVMQAHVHGGAFNFLDVHAFIETVRAQRWRAPGSVQLLMKEEQESRFTLYEVRNPEQAALPSVDEWG